MNARIALFVALGGFTVFYLIILAGAVVRARRAPGATRAELRPTLGVMVVGFVVDFFDALGIGNFATTTAAFRFWRMVPDERIPGTLNVGHTLSAVAEAYVFTAIVPVEPRTLILLIGAAVAGAWLGAGIVAALPRRGIQLGMGMALLAASALMLMTQLGAIPGGGQALALDGGRLAVGLAGNFALGSLMTLGIGLYAPCMVMVSLLGMNPLGAFPIMMGSCAFLMPVASARFVQKNSYDLRASLGLAISGIPAVLLAAYIIKSLPLTAVRWLVVGVVLYAAWGLLRAATRERA